MAQELMREPTTAELAASLNVSEKKIEQLGRVRCFELHIVTNCDATALLDVFLNVAADKLVLFS